MAPNVQGSWTLESFEIQSPTGETRPWGANVRGLLIYSEDRLVSVAINKDPVPTEDPHEGILDSILFYAGTYAVEGNVIRHDVSLASSPARVGKEMIRFASLDGDSLTLTTPQETYGVAKLVWRRRA